MLHLWSRSTTRPALPAVAGELDNVVKDAQVQGANGALPVTILLDGQFTEKAMESQLSARHQVLHIASHFVFKWGEAMDRGRGQGDQGGGAAEGAASLAAGTGDREGRRNRTRIYPGRCQPRTCVGLCPSLLLATLCLDGELAVKSVRREPLFLRLNRPCPRGF
jgi:hypothetical protein